LLVFGIYSFKRKVVAYRNDFCLSCEATRRAYQTRSFDMFHLFFIPVLPLGFWRRWRCSVCGGDPHINRRTRKSFKWAGVVALAFFAAAVWLAPSAEFEYPIAAVWLIRIGFSIAFVFALRHTLKSKPDLRLSEKLKEVIPAEDNVCPLCNGPIVIGDRWRCSQCGVERAKVSA
jgi:fatty acid desaturase